MCLTPCYECPYRKKSLVGYFGGHEGSDYFMFISMDTIVPCHTKSKYVNGLATDITPCVGHALAQIKSCKLPKIPLMDTLHSTLKNQSNFETLTERNLSIFDFREHHGVVES